LKDFYEVADRLLFSVTKKWCYGWFIFFSDVRIQCNV